MCVRSSQAASRRARRGTKDISSAANELSKKKRRPKAPPQNLGVGIFYDAVRRRRPSQPSPTSAEPSKVSDAGSGTFGGAVFASPLETPAVTEPAAVPALANSVAKVVPTGALRVRSFGPDSPGAEKIKSTFVPSPSKVSDDIAKGVPFSVNVPSEPDTNVLHPVAAEQLSKVALIPVNA